MKQIGLITLFSILIIATGCNKKEYVVNYCGFNYSKLVPDSICVPNLSVVARYSGNVLASLKFYSEKNLIRQDTVVVASGIGFLISQNSLGTDTLLRVSSVLGDTARTFVFYKANSTYDLAMIETVLSDTSIKIEFVESGTLSSDEINHKVLGSIKSRYGGFKPIEDYLVINYFYSNGILNYDVLESHSYIKGLGRLAAEKIIRNNGCIYLDMPLVEDRTIVFLYKQVNALMHSH